MTEASSVQGHRRPPDAGLRTITRRAAERLLSGSGLPAVGSRLRRSQALVLAYHDIVPDGTDSFGDASLHLPRSSFAEQLDLLTDRCDVVPLPEVLLPVESSRPRVAITFDDAYRGAVTGGVEELARRRLPATIFVAPGLLGDRTFWWDALSRPDGSGLRVAVREKALGELCGDSERILHELGAAHTDRGGDSEGPGLSGASAVRAPTFARSATEDELREAGSRRGIAVASHTWSHRNLTRIAPVELTEQLARPLAWLWERFDDVLPWLSYPYGLSSPAVEAAAAEAGYHGGVLVEGGWTRPTRVSPFRVPRLNVPAGLSPEGFELRISGVLGS